MGDMDITTRRSKVCFKCGADKPLDEFYRHPMMGDGHLNKCKPCTRKDARANRLKNVEHYRAYDVMRGSRRTVEDCHRYAMENPEKRAAHNAVNNAIRDGRLTRQACMICGRQDTHGHHDNYARLLDVTWLCPPHHFERHKTL
jgi:hypothetical protein